MRLFLTIDISLNLEIDFLFYFEYLVKRKNIRKIKRIRMTKVKGHVHTVIEDK